MFFFLGRLLEGVIMEDKPVSCFSMKGCGFSYTCISQVSYWPGCRNGPSLGWWPCPEFGLILHYLLKSRDVWRSCWSLRTKVSIIKPWRCWRPPWVWNLQALLEVPALLAVIFVSIVTFFLWSLGHSEFPASPQLWSCSLGRFFLLYKWIHLPSTLCATISHPCLFCLASKT